MPYKNKEKQNEYQKTWVKKLRSKLKVTFVEPVKPLLNLVRPNVEPENQKFINEIEEMKEIYIREQLSGGSTYADKNRAMAQRIEKIKAIDT